MIEFVKIGEDGGRYKSVEEYERALVETDTRGFNIVYGNAKKGIIRYYQHQNRPDGVKSMRAPIDLEVGRWYGVSNGGLD